MNNLYVRLAKNNLKNNKSLYVPYMVAGMITVLMFYIMMFINNSAGTLISAVILLPRNCLPCWPRKPKKE